MKKLLAIGSFCALLLSACQVPVDGEDPIKIGYIGPLTGDAAAFGTDTVGGVKLAVDHINEAGGINGRMIQLIAEDGRCTGSDANAAAQKLIAIDKVVAIVGGQCSGETLAAAPIAESAKIVMISPVSSSPDVTDAGDYIFRNYPSDALKTTAMAGYLRSEGYEKIAMITTNADFSVGFANALREDAGDMLVFDETVDADTKDFRSLLGRLKDVDFDVFIPNGHNQGELAPMVVQLRELGFEQLIIGHDVADTLDVVEVAGEAAEGMRAINVKTMAPDSPFGSSYIPKYGEPQAGLVYAAHAYDAAGVLFEAMMEVGTDSTAIRDYFYKLSVYDGAVGKFGFDDNGDVLGISYAVKEVQDGEIVQIGDVSVD